VGTMGGPIVLRARLGSILAAAALAFTSCHAGSGQKTPPDRTDSNGAVVVASFNFPESELLAEIYSQALEGAGIRVRREFDVGPRELVEPALQQGLVDLVPEYLGTALTTVAPTVAVDMNDELAVLAALRSSLKQWNLNALQPSTASDQNGFAVTRRTADRLGLRNLSDLARNAATLTLGGPSECPTRPYCLAGLQRTYGMHFKRFLPYDDASQRTTALVEGVVDVAVTFTTNGRLATGDIVLLKDDQRLQPTEQVVPVVSSRMAQRYGARLVETLNAVSAALDTPGLQFLNWRVGVANKPVVDEARGWLARHGLIRR
jgi:osmoprotectant transport system substrate-binding protein